MVKKLTQENIGEIEKIDQVSFGKGLSHEKYKNMIKENDFYGYFRDGTLLGYICYQRKKEQTVLRRIAVLPEFRRQNIASKLLLQTASYAYHRKLITHTREMNAPAQKFFQKHGFRSVRVKKNFYKNGDSAVMHEKID